MAGDGVAGRGRGNKGKTVISPYCFNGTYDGFQCSIIFLCLDLIP